MEFGAAAHATFGDLGQPLRAVTGCIHLLVGTRNGPASVDGLQATHHPGQIAGDRQVATRQFLQRPDSCCAVIDRVDLFRYNSSASWRASARSFLFPACIEAFLRESHTRTAATCGSSRSCNHAAQVPSSKVTCKLPRRPCINWRIVSAFVSSTASVASLPAASRTAAEIVAW